MADLEWLRTRFEVMEKHLKVSKMYLETHREMSSSRPPGRSTRT
jgi:hypothetical protein